MSQRYFAVLGRINILLMLFTFHQIALAQLPIKPARTISFSTNEGSFMDVDLSPDGKTLAFDLLGNLYTIPVNGGTARQLTTGMALSYYPVWSPNGKQIAYISDYSGTLHINIRNVSGKFHRVLGADGKRLNELTNEFFMNPVLSWRRDGQVIASSEVAYLRTGQAISLPFRTKSSATLLQFGRDTNTAYFIERQTTRNGLQINQYEKEGGSVGQILSGFGYPQLAAATVISPDGKMLAFLRDSLNAQWLMLRNLQTGIEQTLQYTHFVKQRVQLGEGVNGQPRRPHYCFSPDSRYIYIGDGGKLHRLTLADGTDKIIPFTVHVNLQMGKRVYHTFRVTHRPFQVNYIRSAVLSPDGKHLAFTALDNIYIKDLPNGKPRLLAKQPFNQFQPSWSPDSKWIAYVSWCDTVGGCLWKVKAGGGKPEQLTPTAARYQYPAWSPDGEHIAVLKGKPLLEINEANQRVALEYIRLADRSTQVLSDSVNSINHISFRPEGRELICQPYSAQMAFNKVYPFLAAALPGETPLKVLVSTDADNILGGNMQGRLLSADGSYVVYTNDEDLYLAKVNTRNGMAAVYNNNNIKDTVYRFAKGIDPAWSADGKSLAWCYGNKFYRIAFSKILDAKPLPNYKTASLQQLQIVDIRPKPDMVVDIKLTAPSAYGKGTLVLTNVRVLTMQGNKVIEHGIVIIRNGRFAAIGKHLSIPKGATVLDMTGKTIIPGLIDLHLHWHSPTNVLPQQYQNFLANLAYAVTTARDPASVYDSYGCAELLRTGQMLGSRLFSSGKPARYYDGVREIASYAEAKAVAGKRAELGGTFTKQYTLPARIQREWLLMASDRARLNMTNEGSRSSLEDLAMVKDGTTGIEHSTYWGDLYQDYIKILKRSDVFLTPTLQVGHYGGELGNGERYFAYKYWRNSDPKMERFLDARSMAGVTYAKPEDTILSPKLAFIQTAKDYAKLRHNGVNVTLGGHGEVQGLSTHNELWALQMGGLTNMEALQAATIMGAEAIGVQRDLGSIEPGKIADLVILNSNPLDDIHNSRDIKYVMKDGILYDGDTLDEIWPLKKKCPEWRLKINQK